MNKGMLFVMRILIGKCHRSWLQIASCRMMPQWCLRKKFTCQRFQAIHFFWRFLRNMIYIWFLRQRMLWKFSEFSQYLQISMFRTMIQIIQNNGFLRTMVIYTWSKYPELTNYCICWPSLKTPNNCHWRIIVRFFVVIEPGNAQSTIQKDGWLVVWNKKFIFP